MVAAGSFLAARNITALCRTQRSAVSRLSSQRASVANEPSLVILFHGIGSSGAQMRPLASSWQPSLPDTRFESPDAPFQRSSAPGHLWFHIDGNQLRPDRLTETRSAFDKTVREIVDREGYANALPRVAFVGVSQGAIVSLDAISSGRWNVGAAIAYSGLRRFLCHPSAKAHRFCSFMDRMTGKSPRLPQVWPLRNSKPRASIPNWK